MPRTWYALRLWQVHRAPESVLGKLNFRRTGLPTALFQMLEDLSVPFTTVFITYPWTDSRISVVTNRVSYQTVRFELCLHEMSPMPSLPGTGSILNTFSVCGTTHVVYGTSASEFAMFPRCPSNRCPSHQSFLCWQGLYRPQQ